MIEMDSFSFSDFPEDIQLSILSFLSSKEIANFACTSKASVSLCRNDGKLWYSMCERRWGSKTQIKKWGDGKISYKLLYKILCEWENLIGFWRRSGQPEVNISSPPLIFFEWGPSFLAGSRVSPAQNGTYNVLKSPFLWMSLSSEGDIVNLLQPNGEIKLWEDFVNCCKLGFVDELVTVNVNFMGNFHVVVEENYAGCYQEQRKQVFGRSPSSLNLNFKGDGNESSSEECLVSDIYIQVANKISPGALRRQRKKEKERMERRRWEPEHFVKIVNPSPASGRPLQGLWKGLCDDINLDFYLVAYDVGGIICRNIAGLSACSAAPVFWTSKPTFSPLSPKEAYIYESCAHRQCSSTGNEVVSQLMYINSSSDLVIQDSEENFTNPREGEGRLWHYEDGTFGFGFFWDDYIINVKHMIGDGCLLDAMEL